ncbi:GIY-YIG nuclease family protein [Sphingomonas kaistensis]|uniref:GIY-YIG nuclease family protein n=1 Tax=Sphingomonas kaistensis TaxID=298708 RepID=A0ABZ2FYV6_9SPHN
MTGGWVYILTNKPHGTLYTGVTANLAERLAQHRAGIGSQFVKRYNCTLLVFAEQHDTIAEAIHRETCIKEWPRLWKLRLIHERNSEWRDLAADLHLA